ncbi:hypothetical protein FOPG_08021 [Fusarium oxysporum f. sp. conglutinans race 2 54008]|uniref:Monocarboxylate transporter 4 n=1 Tax=Fusarium oxysporum f. sp. conglutinans race 2 54008 TaxID=1089457 RepID=X0HMJ8_FUSOX|nr:hypothetical protein FOPG_08021 [Fusarium oxysporum f. sp. conglutinans race 2 54008]KAG6987683.1 putative mating-type protein A2 [Fusarium oxysporum f. sp. conglutinans]KAI8413296.1 hypothetical protein FOFC_06572 [Fusarium oxysporum]
MRVDNVDMGDTNDSEHRAPPDATSSGEPFLDLDALVFDPGALESNAYEPTFENGLEGNEFELNFDDLWSADMAQLPLAADDTDFTQTHQLQDDTSLQHDGLQRPGTDQLALNFGDLMRNISESPSSTQSPNILTPPIPSPLPPKIGHRFTLDAIRSLKDWFARNTDNPYPNEEEKNMLELQTGLTRTQITNWLANARRRRTTTDSGTQTASGKPGKVPSEYTPARAGTPIPRRRSEKGMHPLQRWVDSPPENEPAAVSAIARAMASGELVTSRSRSRRGTFSSDERIPRRRGHRSTTSSLGTSRSASTDSRSSRGSISGTSSHSRGRSIQKRRPQKTSLMKPRLTFQCTFCTETFSRKYDWQRHENSLHLSLERWECSPDGPTTTDPNTGQVICLFCGESSPSNEHIAGHNPSACQERSFSRKDHLKQHLRLVHNAKLTDLSMKLWRTAQPDIISRCGFCQASMTRWIDRVDHVANHFKMGCTMNNWVGDWGFEDDILKTIEKALPPYLVELERGTPFPFAASGKPPDSPRSAYELITLELAYFISNHSDTIGSLPSHESLQLEACRIMFASEVTFPEANLDSHGSPSWFRDLLLSSDEIAQQARFAPIRSSTESRLSVLRVKGKNSLFEECPLESRLQAFMRDRRMRGLSEVSDGELQKEAGRIFMQMESELQTKPEFVANWLIGFLYNSTNWISDFRRRADLVSADDSWKLPSPGNIAWSTEPTSVQTQHDLSWVNNPSLFDGNGWSFGEQAGPSGASMTRQANEPDKNADQSTFDASLDDFTWLWSDDKSPPKIPQTTPSPGAEGESGLRPTWLGPGIYVLNDPNHLPWFAREMKRWVKAAMSPNNPICHVPSDEELRHQARCLLYNDDDPWNQTPADHAQWLEMFKKEVGII